MSSVGFVFFLSDCRTQFTEKMQEVLSPLKGQPALGKGLSGQKANHREKM